jgi:hypothetical protein
MLAHSTRDRSGRAAAPLIGEGDARRFLAFGGRAIISEAARWLAQQGDAFLSNNAANVTRGGGVGWVWFSVGPIYSFKGGHVLPWKAYLP